MKNPVSYTQWMQMGWPRDIPFFTEMVISAREIKQLAGGSMANIRQCIVAAAKVDHLSYSLYDDFKAPRRFKEAIPGIYYYRRSNGGYKVRTHLCQPQKIVSKPVDDIRRHAISWLDWVHGGYSYDKVFYYISVTGDVDAVITKMSTGLGGKIVPVDIPVDHPNLERVEKGCYMDEVQHGYIITMVRKGGDQHVSSEPNDLRVIADKEIKLSLKGE